MNEEYNIKIMEFNKEEQTIEILGHKIDKSYESWESFLEEMKRLTLLQNNWNELKKWLEEEIKEIDLYIGNLDMYNSWDYDTINDMSSKAIAYKEVLNKMKELEQGKDE